VDCHQFTSPIGFRFGANPEAIFAEATVTFSAVMKPEENLGPLTSFPPTYAEMSDSPDFPLRLFSLQG
jgi:hypothetical protein